MYVGKLAKDVFEDDLIPLFEEHGQIYDLRLMLDPLTGMNRGFAFITMADTGVVKAAVKAVS